MIHPVQPGLARAEVVGRRDHVSSVAATTHSCDKGAQRHRPSDHGQLPWVGENLAHAAQC